MPQKESRPNICRIYSEGSFTEANGVPQTADPPHSFTPNKAKPPWSEGGRGSKISRKPPPAPGTYTCAASSALAKRPSCPSMLSLQLPACRKAPLASICDILRQPRERKESVALRTCCCWGERDAGGGWSMVPLLVTCRRRLSMSTWEPGKALNVPTTPLSNGLGIPVLGLGKCSWLLRVAAGGKITLGVKCKLRACIFQPPPLPPPPLHVYCKSVFPKRLITEAATPPTPEY